MSLLHVSINAKDPKLVSAALGQIMGGAAMPFPPFPDSWIAFAQQDDGVAIEVYSLQHRLQAGPEQVECVADAPDDSSTFAHVALASPKSIAEIEALALRHNWRCRVCNRGPFECVEVWLENRLLIEVLTPEMQVQYRANMKMSNWSNMFGGLPKT